MLFMYLLYTLFTLVASFFTCPTQFKYIQRMSLNIFNERTNQSVTQK